MRSVFAHLVGVTREAVSAKLSEVAERIDNPEWRFPDARAHTLEIGFYDDLTMETEPEELEALRAAPGQSPDAIVYANVSGRVPGDAEARLIVTFLLQHFRGVAWDDYTSHCWTLADIQADRLAFGHHFIDYKGR